MHFNLFKKETKRIDFNYRKRINSNDQFEIDAKVYIGSVPIDHSHL